MKLLNKTIIVLTLLLLLVSPTEAREKYKAAAPAAGYVSSNFGMRNDPYNEQWAFHAGIDIATAMGSPIYALQEGKVTFSGKKGGYGNCIIIDHYYPDIPKMPRIQTKYGHNSQNLVHVGDYVRRGQVIAYAGSTGRSTGPHLHFEVLYRGSAINPMEYLYKLPSYLDYVAEVRERQNYTSCNK